MPAQSGTTSRYNGGGMEDFMSDLRKKYVRVAGVVPDGGGEHTGIERMCSAR